MLDPWCCFLPSHREFVPGVQEFVANWKQLIANRKPKDKMQMLLLEETAITSSDLNAIDWKALIVDLLGDPTLPVEVVKTSKWRVSDVVADYYSKGNM